MPAERQINEWTVRAGSCFRNEANLNSVHARINSTNSEFPPPPEHGFEPCESVTMQKQNLDGACHEFGLVYPLQRTDENQHLIFPLHVLKDIGFS